MKFGLTKGPNCGDRSSVALFGYRSAVKFRWTLARGVGGQRMSSSHHVRAVASLAAASDAVVRSIRRCCRSWWTTRANSPPAWRRSSAPSHATNKNSRIFGCALTIFLRNNWKLREFSYAALSSYCADLSPRKFIVESGTSGELWGSDESPLRIPSLYIYIIYILPKTVDVYC